MSTVHADTGTNVLLMVTLTLSRGDDAAGGGVQTGGGIAFRAAGARASAPRSRASVQMCGSKSFYVFMCLFVNV